MSVPSRAPAGWSATWQRIARKHPFAVYTGPALTWALIIAWGSLAPPDQLPSFTFDIWDKLQHMTAYAGLGFLMLRSWLWQRAPTWRSGVGIVLLGATYGLYLEVLQAFSGFRSFDWGDELVNLLGSGLGVLAGMGLSHWLRAEPSEPVAGA